MLQGDIWWAEAEDKRRPVLIVTRSEAIPVLTAIVVAPLTRTVRRIPTEIAIDPDLGLPSESVAAFDAMQPIRKSYLTERVGRIAAPRTQVCAALGALADC